jgi:uncharacterized protein YukE
LKQTAQYPKIKTSTECLANRVEQVENRLRGTEDKVEELDQAIKFYEKSL